MHNIINQHKKLLFLTFAFGFAAAAGFMIVSHIIRTNALTTAGFDAADIISDAVMANYSSMSESDIQSFLKSKNSCNDTNLSKANPYIAQGYSYHTTNGHFVCMADESFDGESAAHIIWQAAQDYQINPQVILVTLQKEQSLVTDTWPNDRQYRKAMGYGCPDTAPCDSQYYGFKNQIRQAASHFHRVLTGEKTSSSYRVGNSYVQYSPGASCGGTVLNIQNRATVALYIYTPYQPGGTGTYRVGDKEYSCASYGNRNFYSYFVEWFGSTRGTAGYQAITKRYKELGGESSSLGKITNLAINCNIGRDSACVQAYENGIIIYSPESGAWEQYGDIRTRYIEIGSVNNTVGYPSGPINCNVGHDNVCVQAYTNGIIISNSTTGTWEQYGMTRSRYVALGSIESDLGFPITGMNCSIDNRGSCTQAYEHGVIIANAKSGAWEQYGNIRTRYIDLNTINSPLGLPTNKINCQIDDNGSCVQAYERGVIISNSTTGTWEQYGMTRSRYITLGSINSKLGFPISAMNCNIDNEGSCTQAYQNGVIIANAKSGAWEQYGDIRARYSELGSINSELSLPTGAINCNIGHAGACVQPFRNGVIISHSTAGTWEQYGVIRSTFIKAGSVDGVLGFPTSAIQTPRDGNTTYQNYQNGVITVTNGVGSYQLNN